MSDHTGPTGENWGRVFGGFAALAVLWIGVYWLWPASGERGSGSSQGRVSGIVGANGGSAKASVPTAPPPGNAPPPPAAVIPGPTATPVLSMKDGVTGSSAGSAATNDASTRPDPKVIPPKFRAYVVKKGDTLQSIAKKELGSSDLWKAIAQSNPLVSPASLQPGREIKIPLDPANIQGLVTYPVGKPLPPAPSGEPAASEPPNPTTPAPAPVEYTVRSGDTLSRIAKRQYGDSSLGWVIFEGNRDRLKHEDELKVGQVLRIPPKPEKKSADAGASPR